MTATKEESRSRVSELTKGVKKNCAAIRTSADSSSRGWIATGVKILQFDQWLRDNFGMKRSDTLAFVQEEAQISRRQAFYFLSAGEKFGNLPTELQAKIEVGAIKLLAARTVPEEVLERAKTLLETERITIDKARELIGKKEKAATPKRQRIKLEDCTLIIESESANLDLKAVFRKVLAQLQAKEGAAA